MPAATTTAAPPSAFTMEELMWHYEQLQGQAPAVLYANDAVILEELRCGYSSKRCENVRTTKKGGGLHRFCEFHRRRANKNQWRVDNKRRQQRTQQSGDSDKPSTPKTASSVVSTAASKPYSPRASPRVVKKEKRVEDAAPAKAALPEPVERESVDAVESDDDAWLSDSDIAMLQAILFDDGDHKPSSSGFLSLLEDAQKDEPMVSSPTAVYDLHHAKQEWLV